MRAVDREAQRRPKCTGVSASWCPIHGDCTCPRYPAGHWREHEPIDYGDEVDGVMGYDLAAPGCPLHDPLTSDHAGPGPSTAALALEGL